MTPESRNKIESIIGSVSGSYFGEESYKTVEEKTLAYFYFIIKDHPFTDGNKRTASLAFMVSCAYNHLTPDFTAYTLDELAIYIERINEPDHRKIITELSREIFK